MCQSKDEEEEDFSADTSVSFKTIINVCKTAN